ncbi:bifunctional phosphopantothenoylcysteine decarboxylase/phosphopantothenate--cysteine ligase CoaBC [Candidatus Oleimmundimicrobium sp.]|uniref:bifunctional phosphopantothenoylcysteine decarboxylase/phosphopantothenate--cysteine ligase CoaBC n=1 Tax=Candidatus Oleimmundimicrobium sp. TaxID=3060597 RepID=UPI00271BEAC8|nr:bifunctional phosphopantothenoylcysteine decarboxylase/phosphopantothenate--cysteine ligase CoaBC [Candidatus Oleimmundimicrobium sp.]MDO8885408.1 bifunctional phosphopantothenoylcysteine decarboxylase/phosphopantothenate--cysteine ligase CoaBC [Candidatus Oleimmundimicrobium sp.]
MLKEKTIIFGVSGSIAAYKAIEIARKLIKDGATVKVVMTSAATKFITPLTFKTITNQPVAIELFKENSEKDIYHISLSDEADIILVAPATGNIINKVANGVADDLLSTTILAANVPIIFAPAMNNKMFLNEVTQKSLNQLKSLGCRIIEPAYGKLACGEEGIGKLAEVESIVEAVKFELARGKDLENYSIIVTAGGTREPIDPVRFIGNKSSGKTGYAIANELIKRGAKTTLISTPTCLPIPQNVNLISVNTALDIHREVLRYFDKCDAVIMSAAVADFSPCKISTKKIKKDGATTFNLKLKRNSDIIGELGKIKDRQILIGFAAETENLIKNAKQKLEEKNLDLIIANDISKPGIGFGEDVNEITIIGKKGKPDALPCMTKREIARIIVDKLVEALN